MAFFKTTKKVFSLTNQSEKFLNGLTSNSLDKFQNAFVNLHGRIIATFDQLRINDDKFLIVIEESFVPAVLEHIDRYAKLSKVNILAENLKVYFDLNNTAVSGAEEFVIPQKAGQLVLTTKDLPVTITHPEFTLFRLHNNIPLLGLDYKDEMLLNVSATDFVSFTKGCFLGQEPIAKVHHRSKPTWKLVVKFADECTLEEQTKMTSKVLNSASGRVWGFVFVKNL